MCEKSLMCDPRHVVPIRLMLPERAQEVPEPSDQDPYQEVGSILTNLTRDATARLTLVGDGIGPFITGAPAQLRSTNAARRRGCSTTLRNMIFKAEVGGSPQPTPPRRNMKMKCLQKVI
jgi:hypothetical protein